MPYYWLDRSCLPGVRGAVIVYNQATDVGQEKQIECLTLVINLEKRTPHTHFIQLC